MRLKTLASAAVSALLLLACFTSSAGAASTEPPDQPIEVLPLPPGISPEQAEDSIDDPYEDLQPKHSTNPQQSADPSAKAPKASASTYWRTCTPRFDGQPSILAHGTSCSQAQAVIKKVYVKGQTVGPTTVIHAKGWTCRLTGASPRGITCRRGDRVIKAATPG